MHLNIICTINNFESNNNPFFYVYTFLHSLPFQIAIGRKPTHKIEEPNIDCYLIHPD